ncbi:MAG: glycosyltransferase family 4 protein, partial [Bacteroidia bacterium]
HKIIVVSSALSNYLSEKYYISKSQFLVQPNCINPDQAQQADPQKAHKIIAFNQSAKKVIGFVGSMFPYHGVDKLIEAFVHVQSKHSKTILCIMGDGVVLPELKQMVTQLNLKDSVLFTGQIPHSEIMHYIAATDICIMAESNWYGSPVKIFEYGLMGKPIIAPLTIPVQDVMQDQIDGLLVNNQPQMIASAINTLIEQPDFAHQMAHHFHEKVITHYTWQKAALNTLNS